METEQKARKTSKDAKLAQGRETDRNVSTECLRAFRGIFQKEKPKYVSVSHLFIILLFALHLPYKDHGVWEKRWACSLLTPDF